MLVQNTAPGAPWTLIDRVVDMFVRTARAQGLAWPAELDIPEALEVELDVHYAHSGLTAREVLPRWPGVEHVTWDAPRFAIRGPKELHP